MKDARTTLVIGSTMLALGLLAGWAGTRWLPVAGRAGDAAAATASTAAAASAAGQRQVLYWYDPMVPTQRFDKPGKSPFMDMALVPRYADEAGAEAAGGVSVSPVAQQSLGMRVATVEKRPLASAVDVLGTVTLNERDVAVVQARASGFVERVYALAPGDVVAAGAPLAQLLYPEWLAAQNEYLAVRRTGDPALSSAARQRLVLLGMPAALIERVEGSGEPQALSTITAPIAGFVAELAVRQGMTVPAGMTLARINGLATVWIEAAVPEGLARAARRGEAAEVRLAALPGEVLRGKVSAVLPEIQRDSRALRVRVELPNPGLRLRAGLSGQVTLRAAGGVEEAVVPSEAVIRTGRRSLVYVLDGPGRYRPVEVELGPEVDGRIAVRRGLAAGQQVVVSGQFLIDSEASLQGVAGRDAATSQPALADSAPRSAPAGEHETTGRVSAIEDGGITLEHAPVPALKWPAMTMPFQLASPQLVRGLKAGDAVRFRFKQRGDEAVVTAIERLGAGAGADADPHASHAAPASVSGAGRSSSVSGGGRP